MAFKIHAYDADFLKFKTQVAAQYNGIALENVNVDVAAGDHKKAAFLALNPMGKVSTSSDSQAPHATHDP